LFEHDLFGKPLHTFPDHALAENGLAMHFLEFLFSLLELSDLVEMLWKIVRWLFRATRRGVRWMINPSAEPWGRPDIRKGISRFPHERGMLHLSLTRRRRGKWRRASYVLR
jgi:hypothetical protein